VDRGISLPGVTEARLIRIDGSSEKLVPADGAVTLGISGEPVMLRYKSASDKLARDFATASITVGEQPLTILKGKTRDIRVSGPGLKADDFAVLLPPRWTVTTRQDGADVVCTISAPELTDARIGRVMIQRKSGAGIAAELIIPLTIMSPISVEVYATGRNKDGEPGLRIHVTNNGAEEKTLNWATELINSWPINKGTFKLQDPQPVQSYLKGENEGQMKLAAGAERDLMVSIVDSDPQTIYRSRVTVTDEIGRKVVNERMIGGFASAAHALAAPKIDGKLDDAVWAKAETQLVAEERQFFPMRKVKEGEEPLWKGADDLSAKWRAAWDDNNFYLAVEVTDDVHHVQFADGSIWNQDGLQFLFDPTRNQAEKAGKYDYSVGKGTKGEQAWCHLTAHSSVGEGDATKDFQIAVSDLPGSAGGKIYEIAIPWTRLAPFKPAAGLNLGMSMIMNEDDGPGRDSFMGWFSGVHSKQLDLAGDVVLQK
ncbi:MAG: hypothetical protein JXR97_13800, partial [Planctomycetes bacterium]|nr:hypothetical protein [Planctomycetota bacterium]